MIILFLLTTLVMTVIGKPVGWLWRQLKRVDWKSLATEAWDRIVMYSKRVGCAGTRCALQCYYCITDGGLELRDKVLLIAGIMYIIIPRDLLSVRALGILGLVDDAAVGAWIFRMIERNITPEIIQKTEDTLSDWFGPEADAGQIIETP